ncbi:MAG: hypothetical protein HRT64_13815 [Erythrobacter sp.]|nr:hypothetical protein [Erythrobacter sp.]
MRVTKLLTGLALATSMALASPAAAQESSGASVALNVAFFDEIELGNLTLSPVNIFYDTRCEDPEFCFENNQFAISVIMFTEAGLEEVILRLFEPAEVPGGTLTLTNSGTPPSRDGAIGLEKYQLELVFQPTPEEVGSQGTSDPNPTIPTMPTLPEGERSVVKDIQPARA